MTATGNEVAKRSVVSLVATATKALLSFVTVILVAKGLQPELFGIFSFLMTGFAALTSLLDMGSSQAFFTFISKRERSKIFFSYYFIWQVIQFLLSILIITLLIPEAWFEDIWQGEGVERVLLAFVAVFMSGKVWMLITQIGESQRLTIRVQSLNVGVAVVHLVVIGILFMLDQLSIELIYLLIAAEFLLAAIVSYFMFAIRFEDDDDESLHSILKEYWVFCLPLIPYAWVSMAYAFADTWMLQYFGGASEQAYYSVALRFTSVIMLVTVSLLKIIWKEVAEANHRGNIDQIEKLYNRSTRILFTFAAIIAGLLFPWAKEILLYTLGEVYLDGYYVLLVMFFFPIYQAIGQLVTTMYVALEFIKEHVVFGIIYVLISAASSYFVLATPSHIVPGLGLGSFGLAIKLVILQIMQVTYLMWWLSRKMNWTFTIVYQFVEIVLFTAIGLFLYYVLVGSRWFDFNIVVSLILYSSAYATLSSTLFIVFPELIGMNRSEIRGHIHKTNNFVTLKIKKQ